MVEQGIKPMYVFDGKPPDLKAGVVRSNFTQILNSRASA